MRKGLIQQDGWWKESSVPLGHDHFGDLAGYAAALDLCGRRRRAVDVGANIGLWSKRMARDFERVDSFEPWPVTIECFAENTKEEKNITLHEHGLAEREGLVDMTLHPRSHYLQRKRNKGEHHMIFCRTLDSLNLDAVDLLKIDTDGGDQDVIAGAVDTLRRCRPVVCIETKFWPTHKNDMENLGYSLAHSHRIDAIYVSSAS